MSDLEHIDRVRDLAAELAPRLDGHLRQEAPLAPLTTFRVGGRADLLVEAESVEDLVTISEVVGDSLPVAIVGRGSNLLVSDHGFRGVAVKLGRSFRAHERTDRGLRLGGAVYLPAAARLTARLGLTGFEFAAEIPGTFGGAVRMNAGAHDTSMADVLAWTSIVDLAGGVQRRLDRDDLAYSYRRSSLTPSQVVVEGEIVLEEEEGRVVGERIASYLSWRREAQPGGLSAGSVFKNPQGDAAGRLIDEAGGKGMRVGDAEVSSVHANFIVCGPRAKAADVWALIRAVQELVVDRSGVELETEVRVLGEFDPIQGQLEGR